MRGLSSCVLALVCSVFSVSGCGGEELPGFYYEVTVSGDENGCTSAAPSEYSEVFEYRVDPTIPNSVKVYVGDVLLGSGVLDGCELIYRSSTFSDTRESYTVRWGLRGDAVIALGDSAACNAGAGWIGTETIEVSSSNDPEVAPGCAYELTVEGSFLREVR